MINRICGLLCAIFWLVPVGFSQIQSIGVAGDGEFTRITISSLTDLSADTFLLEEDGARMLYLYPETLSLSDDAYWGTPTGGIEAYEIDQGRIVFELDQPMLVVREIDLPPTGNEDSFRLILDLSRVSETRFTKTAKSNAKRYAAREVPDVDAQTNAADVLSVPASPPTLKPARLGVDLPAVSARKRIIVIDPGHGGRDPGAPIATGGQEKDIVLQLSMQLKEKLSKDERYEVRLTRETDIYVEHEDRLTMARDWGAELFISIHADGSKSSSVYGASVYTISSRGERRIEGVTDKYGWKLPIEDGSDDDVADVLTDLIKRETKSNSAIFAEFLVPELAKAGPLLRNSHRQANFFVLLAPDVPAVLVEVGFLSNRADAKRLKTKRGRDKSAAAIKRAIDAYFDRQDLLLSED